MTLIHENKKLVKRVLEISHDKKLSHISSCITAVPIINHIFREKKKREKFVLSAGHAGLALYVVLEKYLKHVSAEDLLEKHGIHPNLDPDNGIDCSTGSLGHGLPIALGMALANPEENVYCLVSDGEMAEGSCWEALTVARKYGVTNLKIHLNANGFSAYDLVDIDHLITRIRAFDFPVVIWRTDCSAFSFLRGIGGHYRVMSDEEYESATLALREFKL